ncbi:hypothetical protein ES703_56347 [subsurface metagenome]
MKGIIFLWYGSILSIPPGWALCDGTQGTPDLNYKFVVGAGSTYNPGDFTTTWSHRHDFLGNGHDHDVPAGDGVASGPNYDPTVFEIPETGRTGYTHAFPPYKALCYIMKLP